MLDGKTLIFLERLKSGDRQARHELIEHAYGRLEILTRRMLKGYPQVKRWEATWDVLHNALHRLDKALKDTTPQTSRHFFNLAALEIRRELIDLARRYLGPQGHGALHKSNGGVELEAQPDYREGSASLEEWTRFHEKVESLPQEEKEVFGGAVPARPVISWK